MIQINDWWCSVYSEMLSHCTHCVQRTAVSLYTLCTANCCLTVHTVYSELLSHYTDCVQRTAVSLYTLCTANCCLTIHTVYSELLSHYTHCVQRNAVSLYTLCTVNCCLTIQTPTVDWFRHTLTIFVFLCHHLEDGHMSGRNVLWPVYNKITSIKPKYTYFRNRR